MNLKTVGYVEKVHFVGPNGPEKVKVKFDTGAKRTAICETIQKLIGITNPCGSVTVTASNGTENRPIYELTVVIGDTYHTVEASVTDRTDMTYDAIIGRDILSDYLIDPNETFLLQ